MHTIIPTLYSGVNSLPTYHWVCTIIFIVHYVDTCRSSLVAIEVNMIGSIYMAAEDAKVVVSLFVCLVHMV